MNFLLALRSLFKQKQSNLIKIISLGLGLAAGLTLITNALFELSYDSFYPDSENIYMVQQRFKIGDQAEQTHPSVSGAVAPTMEYELPEILASARFTSLGPRDAVFFNETKNRFVGTFILADSCLFDIVPRPMLAGNAK
jgi:putative ABC transport system permease protein